MNVINLLPNSPAKTHAKLAQAFEHRNMLIGLIEQAPEEVNHDYYWITLQELQETIALINALKQHLHNQMMYLRSFKLFKIK